MKAKVTFGGVIGIVVLLALLLVALPGSALAAVCDNLGATGNWSTIAWSCPGGPTATDDVVISGGQVRLNQNATIQSLTVNAGATLAMDGYTLTVTGNTSILAGGVLKANLGANTLDVQGNLQVDGLLRGYEPGPMTIDLVFNGTAAQTLGGAGATSVRALTNNNSAGVTVLAANNPHVKADFINNGPFTANSGVFFYFDGTAAAQTIGGSVKPVISRLRSANPNGLNLAVDVDVTSGLGLLQPLNNVAAPGPGVLTLGAPMNIYREAAGVLAALPIFTDPTQTFVQYGGPTPFTTGLELPGEVSSFTSNAIVTLDKSVWVHGGCTINPLGGLRIGSNTLTLDLGFTMMAGATWQTNVDGTVIYNQVTDGQKVLALQYGNLKFFNGRKMLAPGSEGNIKIWNTFFPNPALMTPGLPMASYDQVTWSKVEFNGYTMPQYVPEGFYYYWDLIINNTDPATYLVWLNEDVVVRNDLTVMRAFHIGTVHTGQPERTIEVRRNVLIDSQGVLAPQTQTPAGTPTVQKMWVKGDFINNGALNGRPDADHLLKIWFNGTIAQNVAGNGIVFKFGDFINDNQVGLTLDGSAVPYIDVRSDWVNNGLALNILPGTKINFNFAGQQNIGGSQPTKFWYLDLRVPPQVYLNQNIEIEHNFAFGTLYPQGNLITIDNGCTVLRGDGTGIAPAGAPDPFVWPPSPGWINLIYAGSQPTVLVTGFELPASTTLVQDLLINRTAGVQLDKDAQVNQSLNVQIGDLDTTAAFKMTLPATAASIGGKDVIGTVKRLSVAGVAKAFGNPNNTLRFSSATTCDVEVTLTKAAPAGFPTAVTREYVVTPDAGCGVYTAVMQLRYVDPGELNGNVEPFQLYHQELGVYVPKGGTNNMASNFVNLTNIADLSGSWAIAP